VQVINSNEYYDGFGNPLNIGQGAQGISGPQGNTGPQGFTGPQGPAGNPALNGSFTNVTSITVTHSSGVYPIIQFLDNQGYNFLPDSILHTSTSSIAIVFATTSTGTYIIGGGAGPQGIKGATGADGVIGTNGNTGNQGFTGPQGNTGFQGLTGPQGNTGLQGFTGPQGNTGVQGVTGPQGPTGNQGITGPQGNTGIQGFTGPQGVTGNQGFTGPQGLTGPQGFTGNQGETGPQGNTGFQGFTGPQGYTGPQGNTGPSLPFYYSSTPPIGTSLTAGSRWFHSDTGVEYIYVDDGDSLQWVQPTSTIAGSLNHYTWGITVSSYTISLYSQYGPEYFGVSFSGTSYVNLPTNVSIGKTITIKDESGGASVNIIYINPYVGELIDNQSQIELNTNYGSLTILRRNNNWWRI
jgi:hypothetical protein